MIMRGSALGWPLERMASAKSATKPFMFAANVRPRLRGESVAAPKGQRPAFGSGLGITK
jgi:hypothetical protein